MQASSTDAAVLAAQAALNEMKARDERMILRAPVTGRILQRTIRPGDISSPATASPYFRIARDGLIELDAELPDASLSQVKEGDSAHVTLPSGQVLAGKVRFVSPRVDASTSLGEARIELPYDPALRPGGFAKAAFDGLKKDGLTVPASAVRYESGGPALMVVDKNDRVKQTPVKLGARLGDYVEVIDGPPAGTMVLTTGSAFTLDGDVIQPIEQEAAAAPAAGTKAQ